MEISAILSNKKVRNHINDDLALFILSKLPLKSLKRFTCVRKSWSLLYENEHFMNLFRNNFLSHHHSSYDDTFLLIQASLTEFYMSSSFPDYSFENTVKHPLPNPFEEEDPDFCILNSGSITGILCLYKDNGPDCGRAVIWNPATDAFKVIPQSCLEFVPPYQQFETTLHGFGYDHVRDDYKLLRCVSYFPPTPDDCDFLGLSYEDLPWNDIQRRYIWEIYSLKSNSWTTLDDIDLYVSPAHGFSPGELMYLDGICHWWYYTDNFDKYDEPYLVSFDLVNEVFFSTPIPLDIPLDEEHDEYSLYPRHFFLIVLNASVALISFNIVPTTFEISILSEIGVRESWIKLFTIGPSACIQHPIGAGKNGEIFFTNKNGEIVLYDLSLQMIDNDLSLQMIHMEVDDALQCFDEVLIYKENFVPF